MYDSSVNLSYTHTKHTHPVCVLNNDGLQRKQIILSLEVQNTLFSHLLKAALC